MEALRKITQQYEHDKGISNLNIARINRLLSWRDFIACLTEKGKISAQPHTSLCTHILLIIHSTLCL